jgi:hypothetical protein
VLLVLHHQHAHPGTPFDDAPSSSRELKAS